MNYLNYDSDEWLHLIVRFCIRYILISMATYQQIQQNTVLVGTAVFMWNVQGAKFVHGVIHLSDTKPHNSHFYRFWLMIETLSVKWDTYLWNLIKAPKSYTATYTNGE